MHTYEDVPLSFIAVHVSSCSFEPLKKKKQTGF